VNELFATLPCNCRAIRKSFSHPRFARSFSLNVASPGFSGEDLYTTIEDFFPTGADFRALSVSALIASGDGNYVAALAEAMMTVFQRHER
jgi:hypothetical protein